MTWLDDLEAWLLRHDTDLDLITVWAIVASLTIWALVKMASRVALINTMDRTDVGRSLKTAKTSEFLMGCALATLYGLTLIAFYAGWSPDFWVRLALRLFLIAGTVGAAVAGIRFARALWRTNNAPPERGNP